MSHDMRELVEAATAADVVRGVAAGTIATILMSALLVGSAGVRRAARPGADRARAGGLRERPLWVLAAIALHFGYGALAGAFFAAATERVNVVSGLFFGLVLWGVAVAVYAPLVGSASWRRTSRRWRR